jgi:iron(III) transport system substrate-binding protein
MKSPRFGRRIFCALFTVLISVLTSQAALAGGEVNIYSYRQPFLIEPLLKAFTGKTGIQINVIYAASGLDERMAAEGANSPADLLFTVDIGRLTSAVDKGVTQKVDNAIINANIPASLRDPAGHWFGLTARVRVILASKDRVKQDKITYEELADPKWKGKICTRSGQHVYNIALFASMIAHHGEEWAEKWLTSLKNNLARKPAGNDRAQAKGVYAGECDLAIANHYYMAAMITNDKHPEQKEWAKAVKLLWPNNEGRGVHVNISGMALAKHAPNKENAIKLMEFLSSAEGQKLYASVNNEYPVKKGVPAGEIAESFGKFKRDDLPLADIAKLRIRASELVDKVGYNNGPSS